MLVAWRSEFDPGPQVVFDSATPVVLRDVFAEAAALRGIGHAAREHAAREPSLELTSA
jgi:hypothetical protein